MKNTTLRELFVRKVMALYDIETVIMRTLPKVSRRATDKSLKKMLRVGINDTREHLTRLEWVFAMLGMKPRRGKVEAIRGMASDAEWIVARRHAPEDKAARDAVIIASLRYMAHYEAAAYTSAVVWAKSLKYDGASTLLKDSLFEAKEASRALLEAAEAHVM